MKISGVLVQEIASSRTSGNLYIVVVQSVLLYGLKAWVVTERMAKAFERVYQIIAQRIVRL